MLNMGDLFFVIKMFIYTLILVVFMQVKVGTTTVEEKILYWTHQSELAGNFQNIAQGAIRFMSDQIYWFKGKVQGKVMDKIDGSSRPGSRLKSKVKEIKDNFNKQFESEEVDEAGE